ncbi:MAG: hypothetical protein M0Z87_03210 [Actinomycetota bacterium]|nr:hypothetical protein [Actinomycetota bacterium]
MNDRMAAQYAHVAAGGTRPDRRPQSNPVIELLEADHAKMQHLLEMLSIESRRSARACLAQQVVTLCCTIEDVRERTLYREVDAGGTYAREDRADRCSEIKQLLQAVDSYTHRVLPENVHAFDGAGFEEVITRLTGAIRTHLEIERREMLPRVEALSDEQLERLAASMAKARRNSLSRPHRHARGALQRSLCRFVDRLHRFEDAPDYYSRDLRRSLARVR